MLGGIAFIPFRFSSRTSHDLAITTTVGATLYVIASTMYVLAVGWDMLRTRQLKAASQISLLNFIIESWVSALYLAGSLSFLVGSFFSYPAIFTPHVYGMFLFGELCFMVGSVYSISAQLHGARINIQEESRHTTKDDIHIDKLMSSTCYTNNAERNKCIYYIIKIGHATSS